MKRRGKGSKEKGGEFERKICKHLSLWLSQGKRDDLLWRAAMSGGRATIQQKQGHTAHAQAGDISAIDPLGSRITSLFYFECKSYKNLEIPQFCLCGRGFLWKVWVDTAKKAKAVGKVPCVIARQNGLVDIILLNPRGLRHLGLLQKQDFEPPQPSMCFQRGTASAYIFAEVLAWADPRDLPVADARAPLVPRKVPRILPKRAQTSLK